MTPAVDPDSMVAAGEKKKPLHLNTDANLTTLTAAESLSKQRCRIRDKHRQVRDPSAVAVRAAKSIE